MTDINGYSGETFSINGILTNDTTTSTIDLTNNEINLIADTVFINGNDVISTVDLHTENLKNIENLTKAGNNTTLYGVLNIETPLLKLDEPLLKSNYASVIPNLTTQSIGMRFTISNTISVFRFGVLKSHWINTTGSSISCQFYEEGNPILFAGASINNQPLTEYGDYYVINLSLLNRKILHPGTWRFAVTYFNNMNRYADTSMNFSSSIYNVEACVGNFAEYPTIITPDLHMTYGGFFWFDDIDSFAKIDMTNNDITNVNNLNTSAINSINIDNYNVGLFTGISAGLTITGSVETSILDSVFILGSTTVPPDRFNVGDSFQLNIAGNINSVNNAVLTVRVKSIGLVVNVLSEIVIVLVSTTNQFFEIEVDFVIRSIGISGSINSSQEFSYSDGIGSMKGTRKITNSFYNSTVSNQLDVTASFDTANIANSIKVQQVSLSKKY